MLTRLTLTVLALMLPVTACAAPARSLQDRMAAWHDTHVAIDEMRPNSCIGTYIKDRFTHNEYELAKLVVGVEANGRTIWPAEARSIQVDDFPGGVRASYVLNGIEVTTEIVPLMVGRDTSAHDGAAVFTVSTKPAAPVVVRCGEGCVSGFEASRAAWLRSDTVGAAGDTALVEDGMVVLKSTRHPLAVAARCTGEISTGKSDEGGEFAVARFGSGSGSIVVAFGPDAAAARRIVELDAASARKRVTDYYAGLLKCRIETPEKVMDQAFAAALYNLEYNWIKPYGWNECIHHWPALWHMQHTAACEWIGQADRSRECNVTTAEHLFPNGAVPQFMPSGATKRDFGGSNQFFAWQVRHYWSFTADRPTIERLAPAIDRVVSQTFDEYDPDRDGLLAWGQQIGNQEDYVSTPYNGTTPSVEGINMLRTAAELWRALGQDSKADAYERRAKESLARLKEQLWQPDLGFFAFYKDPFGVMRLDGQYHTLIYPVIWDVLDPLDSWTSMLHLRERMTGESGSCYCSNGFPNHVGGTWGMQTGAAQQPWAAMGLAAVGLRNETYRPLKAAANWAMNPDHRGSWPEIAEESTAAYFSPPAGLYVQSVIEALFGLTVNRPAGTLTIAPSFPDSWPSAKLYLPDHTASYTCKGNPGKYGVRTTLDYTVTSRAPLARRLRWILPPCTFGYVKVNGKPASYKTQPGVECITLCIDTPAETKTRYEISLKPISYTAEWLSGAAVEGDTFGIFTSGFDIERIEDRSRVFSSIGPVRNWSFDGTVRTGQVEPYTQFGRIGQMDFSRRTFFVLGKARTGARFWVPVSITVLPRYECTASGDVEPAASGARVKLVVRNNSSSTLKGAACLSAARNEFPFEIDLQPRSERDYTIAIPKNLLALFSPGENKASVLLPGEHDVPVTLVASGIFADGSKLLDYASARVAQIPLPQDSLLADASWREVREFYAYGHMPWAWSKPPMEALAGKSEITVPGLPGVRFKLEDRKFLPVSWKMQRPTVTIPIGGPARKKVYLLVIPFLDNHDTYAPVARVDVGVGDRTVFSRTLRFPGDVDWWCPQEVVGDFSTARNPRPDRFGLLPMLGDGKWDWPEARPPQFPQPEFWATCLPLKTPTSVMSVIEIDLGRAMPVRYVSLSTIGVDPAFGLVAVSAETSGGSEIIENTEWNPPARFREPRLLFEFVKEGDLLGWTTEGAAFSVAPVPGLFTTPTLNSLAKAGESATGKAISPGFAIGPDDDSLIFKLQGGNSLADSGPGSLTMRLVDAITGEELERVQVSGSHVLREGRMPVTKARNRKVRLELEDLNTGPSYAWLGVKEVWLSAD